MTLWVRVRTLVPALANVEIWAVAAIIAATFVWTRLLPAAIILAAFFLVVRWIALGRLTIRTPSDAGIVLLLVMVPVTLWSTSFPDITNLQVYRLLSGIALYYALANWCNSPGRLRLAIAGLASASLILILIAPFSVRWPLNKLPFMPAWLYQRFLLVPADAVHPNVLAGTLILLLPIILAWLSFTWRELHWSERLLFGVAVVFMIGALGLTQSRGAWIAFGISLILLAILRWRWGWISLVVLAGFAAVIVSKYGIRFVFEEALLSGATGGIDGRLEIWIRALAMIRDFPVTGIGMGSFMPVVDGMYPFFTYPPGSILHAHNLFLQVAVDLGVLGLVGWLTVLITGVMSAWLVYRWGRRHHNLQAAAIGAGLLCAQAALVVHGLTDAVTWGMVKPAPLVWAIWGLGAAAWFVYLRFADLS